MLFKSQPQPWQRWLQIEVSAGLGLGLRLGVNFGELFDLLVGLTTVDVAHDDVR